MNIYGLLIGIGIVIGIELITRTNKKITYTDIILLLISALIGARLLFILHNIEEIKTGVINPFAIWDGGLAFYGGLIGILICIFFISKHKKIKYYEISDTILLTLPLIQAIGRIGNFFNYELYGKPTNLPWGIFIPIEYRDSNYITFTHFHPVFLYESILNIINFAILLLLHKKTKSKGIITGAYLVNYAIIRLGMNMLRIDKEFIFGIETSNLLSIIFLFTGIIIIMKQTKNKTRLAKFFSRTVMILLIALTSVSIFIKTNLTPKYKIFLIIFTFVLPILSVVLFKLFDITSDLTVSKKEERPKLFLTCLLFFLISLYISFRSGNTQLLQIYTTLNLTFFLGTLITFYWKISFHMILATLSVSFLIFLWKIPQSYLLLSLIPLIGWSRLQLRRHSIKQVIGGTLLAAICSLIVLTFINF
jgi:phosphatidylglycerol:prolipoprotein diacylglycerol transferase